ncbi:MAG TPA: glycoside hydrolase family 97 catalytic domain-containing protein [Sedimentisphaerales bacterium]|jgi:alpha-glucosidase|nr:glycoside hydrolase family 97 catalytic domain-containing protein [Sedimentisphaerales bacterium]HNU27906.1 glycoside hydrolase family 97 catalytic domain-containing protein [Sedimentisphaerales bacterium]
MISNGTSKAVAVAVVLLALGMAQTVFAQPAIEVKSPDGRVAVVVRLIDPGQTADYPAGKIRLYYEVKYDGAVVLPLSPLGIRRQDEDFVDAVGFIANGGLVSSYQMFQAPHGKRRTCSYGAMEHTLVFGSPRGGNVELIVRAQNDGVAFRYRFPENSNEKRVVVSETTGFRLPEGGKVWAHPYDKPSKYTPAYETYYVNGAPVGTPSSSEAGWAFPVLFCNADRSRWGLVTDAGLDGSYCGCRLEQNAPQGVYRIRFPEPGDGDGTGAVEPSWTLPWATPWRVIVVGDSLADIVESTLVTDVCPPSIVKDTSWIQPGRASWSWLFDHDSPQDCTKLKAWVDLAAEMGWEYSLVDANWDRMKNGTIHDLIAYANSKGVGLLLWYNSGGPHNYVSEKPRGLMTHREIRREEFQTLKRWGIKGVKVDFFQSDKQNIIQLYHDILLDAADAGIMVNFHGCTLPRGWSRTYPHLMSMEAVRGEECYSFDEKFTTEAPIHNVILPFTRNVVGPMDYTPVMFQDNVYRHLTTYCHELALPVIFESGWLHFAGGPKEYLDLPDAPKNFLKAVPVAWDDTKFLAGEPGEYVVLARKSGKTWYVAGINGQDAGRDVDVTLSFLDDTHYTVTLIADGKTPREFETDSEAVTAQDHLEVRLLPYGGFTAVLTPTK